MNSPTLSTDGLVSFLIALSSSRLGELSAWRESGAGPAYGTYLPPLILMLTRDDGLMPLSVKIQSPIEVPLPSKMNALAIDRMNVVSLSGSLRPLSYASLMTALMNCSWWRWRA